MKLVELKEKIDRILELHKEDGEDLDVRIVTQDKSIGARATVGIDNISVGFDWELGKALLVTDNPIYQETNDMSRNPIAINLPGYLSTVYICPICEKRVNKKDAYCRHCGKKLK